MRATAEGTAGTLLAPGSREHQRSDQRLSNSVSAGGRGDLGLIRDAAAAQAAIAIRIFRQVLLVIVLGVEELGCIADFCRDRAPAGRRQQLLVGALGILSRLALLLVEYVDRRAVLRADIVALTHALRRIVRLPEGLQPLLDAA